MNDIITTYTKLLTASIDAAGIFPLPAIAVEASGKDRLMSFATTADEMFLTILAQSKDFTEYVMGFDSYTKEGQGTTLDSAVIIFHIRRDAPPRIGVFEYSYNNGAPLTRPVNWENEFWTTAYAPLVEKMDKAIKSS